MVISATVGIWFLARFRFQFQFQFQFLFWDSLTKLLARSMSGWLPQANESEASIKFIGIHANEIVDL